MRVHFLFMKKYLLKEILDILFSRVATIKLFRAVLWSEKIESGMEYLFGIYLYMCLIILLSHFAMAQINLYYFVERTKEKR